MLSIVPLTTLEKQLHAFVSKQSIHTGWSRRLYLFEGFSGPEKGQLGFVRWRILVTRSWYTWWQIWFPQRRHTLPALLAVGAWQQSRSTGRWWWTSWCSGRDGRPKQQPFRTGHWQKSSWCSWPWRTLQCRCTWHKTLSSWIYSSSYLPWWWPWRLCLQPFQRSWVACCSVG